MLFPFLTVFMIIIIFLAIRYRSNQRHQDEMQENFWSTEAVANATPPANLDNLDYINIPLEKFPLGFSSDEKILSMEEQLKDLASKPILNLTGKTNTELKLTYGVPNLEKMMEIGENFDVLTIVLKDYANALMEQKKIAEAITVLEFGAGIGTDISQHYVMLGQCYQILGKKDKIHLLIDMVSQTDLMLAPSIIRQLTDLMNSEASFVDGPEDFPI